MGASAHAILSPSSSHRWLNCTPSARLEENVVDNGSEFAEQGTCAHALCELKLKTLLGEDTTECQKEYDELKEKWFDTEMETCTDEYVALVWNKYQEALKTCPESKLIVEARLTFTTWIPDSFGTSDATIVTDDTMEVIDFKYGRGVEVSAVKNPQMAIYALGAISDYGLNYDIKLVRMTIVQPRIHNFSEWEIDAKELLDWADKVLTVQAKLAWNGEGTQIAGDWCRFCRVKARCKELANNAIACYLQHTDKNLIQDDEMPPLLDLVPAIRSWCDGLESYATAKALSGTKFKGFKLVEGRTTRVISDKVKLVEKLGTVIEDTDELYKPRELKAIGELEKLVGKKQFGVLSEGCMSKAKGKPTLVPSSDKRKEMTTSSAQEDFEGIEENE